MPAGQPDQWSWQHLSNDVASDQAAALFFGSDAPVEAYRDCFYASAGELVNRLIRVQLLLTPAVLQCQMPVLQLLPVL